MAVVPVAINDAAPRGQQWSLEAGSAQQRSPIPRGLLVFSGTAAVALKDAANVTSVVLTLTMPTGGAFLPRNFNWRFQSDDLTNDFNVRGHAFYTRAAPIDNGAAPLFTMLSPGGYIVVGTIGALNWVPAPGSPKLMLAGGDTMTFSAQDQSSDASTAGDISYWMEFYVFDQDQIDKWQVNTPIPTISHTSF